MFIIHPPSLLLGIVIGLFFAGPLAMYVIAAIAVANKLGGRK